MTLEANPSERRRLIELPERHAVSAKLLDQSNLAALRSNSIDSQYRYRCK
jgi:hypothetical protein